MPCLLLCSVCLTTVLTEMRVVRASKRQSKDFYCVAMEFFFRLPISPLKYIYTIYALQ